jgi:hypothetical protein
MRGHLRDRLIRVRGRPRPELWNDDEPMTLAEAVAVFFPNGPLTLSSLRTAVCAGQLAVVRVAGKDLTTPKAVKQLVTPCPAAKQNRPACISGQNDVDRGPGSSLIAAGKSAQAATRKRLKELRMRSKTTSRPDTSLPLAPVIPLPSRSETP